MVVLETTRPRAARESRFWTSVRDVWLNEHEHPSDQHHDG